MKKFIIALLIALSFLSYGTTDKVPYGTLSSEVISLIHEPIQGNNGMLIHILIMSSNEYGTMAFYKNPLMNNEVFFCDNLEELDNIMTFITEASGYYGKASYKEPQLLLNKNGVKLSQTAYIRKR